MGVISTARTKTGDYLTKQGVLKAPDVKPGSDEERLRLLAARAQRALQGGQKTEDALGHNVVSGVALRSGISYAEATMLGHEALEHFVTTGEFMDVVPEVAANPVNALQSTQPTQSKQPHQ